MILWTAMSGVIQYFLADKLGWQFMIFFASFGFLSGQLGQKGVSVPLPLYSILPVSYYYVISISGESYPEAHWSSIDCGVTFGGDHWVGMYRHDNIHAS